MKQQETNHITEQDKMFMREAIRLADESVKNGGGPFGAVIVRDGKIIAGRSNSVTLNNDPTAHAEVNTIREACRLLGTFDLSDCVIYTSCEPCPMCLGAIYWARPKALYFAADRHCAARHGFDDKFICQCDYLCFNIDKSRRLRFNERDDGVARRYGSSRKIGNSVPAVYFWWDRAFWLCSEGLSFYGGTGHRSALFALHPLVCL